MDLDDIPKKHEVMAGAPRSTLRKIVQYLAIRKGWSAERIAELFEDVAEYARDPHRADAHHSARTVYHDELVDEDDPDGTPEAAAERALQIHERLDYGSSGDGSDEE